MLTAPAPLLQTVSVATDPASTCANCRFAFDPGRADGRLECRANAPTVQGGADPAFWPLVGAGQWCGIWAPLTPAATVIPQWVVATHTGAGNALVAEAMLFESPAAAAAAVTALTAAGWACTVVAAGP